MYDVQVCRKGEWYLFATSLSSLEAVWSSLYWARNVEGELPESVMIGRTQVARSSRAPFPRPTPNVEAVDSVEYNGEFWGALKWLAGCG